MVKLWESKNAQRALKGSGLTLMAMSLTACGGSDSATTVVTPVTPLTPGGATFELTPLDDVASTTQALNGSLPSAFRFTSGNETVSAISATIEAGDTLIDGSTTDNDVINITSTGGTMAAMSAINIETANVTFASGASSVASFTNFSGLKTVNVDGAVAGKVLKADGATIAMSDYTRELTIENTTFAGTKTNGDAETVNVSVSGATYGTTAATQSSLVVSAATNGQLETLNITSTGDAANVFKLASGGSDTFGTINVLGSADATIRVAKGDVSGNTVDASDATGVVSLSLDVNSSGATSVNAANWTGIDNLVLRDSATASATDNATFNSVKTGQNVVVANSVGTLTVAAQGATYTAPAASAGLELNGTSTTAGVTVGTYAAENITALNLVSTGLASSTSTTAANTISSLDGDFSTITITGDTSLALSSLAIDNKQTATGDTAARAVTVDASAMTGNAFLDVTAAGGAKVAYSITATAGADTIVVNDAGATVVAGDGKDTITGGDGDDTIDGGAGNDHIDVSYGEDTLTGGAGNDTFDVDATGAAAVKHTVVFGDDLPGSLVATEDDFVVTVNGVTYKMDVGSDSDTEADVYVDFVNTFGTTLLAEGIAVTSTGATTNGILKFEAVDAGAAGAFTATAALINKGVFDAVDAVTASAKTGTDALDVLSTITDFASGDILDLADVLTEAGISYYEGAAASSAAANNVYVLTDAAGFADAEAAEDAVAAGTISTDTADGIFVFINSTLGHAQVVIDGDIDTNSVNLGASDGDAVLFNLTSITNATDLAAAFSADSFVI